MAEEYAEKENSGRFGNGLKEMLTRRGKTMQMSFAEGKKVLSIARIDDVPLLHGSRFELKDKENMPDSEGADFIVREAMKQDARPLFVCFFDGITDLAIAYLKQPKVADKLTAVWIGGGPYPTGECEFKLYQDILAANIIIESNIPLWQIPSNVYRTMEVGFAELVEKVAPCGELGKYLFEQLIDTSSNLIGVYKEQLPETWILGDNPTVSVLLERGATYYDKIAAPKINNDATYAQGNREERLIRVYRSVDVRFTLSDIFAKMRLCYGK